MSTNKKDNKKNMLSKEKIINLLKFCIPIVISMISLIVAIDSRNIAKDSYESAEELEPLQFYLQPIQIEYKKGTMKTKVEVKVTNGAIGNIRVIDYKDGQVMDIANNDGGTITKSSNKKERILEFEYEIFDSGEEYIMTQYLLIHGRDGSKHIGMILYHVDLKSQIINAQYYSTEDLVLAEMDANKEMYRGAFKNYRELIQLLRDKMEL